jgi:hypothetical protein
VPLSGGHNHDIGRPSGSFVFGDSSASITVVTDTLGKARFVYFAPRASGQYVVSAITQGANGVSDSVTVGYKGLIPLVQTVHDSLIGTTQFHPSNHFGKARLAQGISDLADSLFNKTGDLLFVNDESLAAGGLFDIKGDWTNPHCSHLDGVAADVRLRDIPRRDSIVITRVWTRMMGDSTVLREGDPVHFHLKLHR